MKAHSQIQGNERADELAKAAALQAKTKIDYDKIPVSYVKRTIREDTTAKWQQIVDEASTGRITKNYFKDVKVAYKIMQKIGKMDNLLAQLLTGHGGFKAYLHKYGLSSTPYCVCDDCSEETIEHVLTECPIYSRRRWEAEVEMECAVRVEHFPDIMGDDNRRRIFLKFALWAVRSAHRRNGGRSVRSVSHN